jgi:predicted nucleotidyltransferase
MGIYMNNNSLGSGLFSKTRQAVIALFYGQADSSFYTKQVLDAVKLGRGTVQRELKNLTDAGIIHREVQGRQVYYRANKNCPIFNELRSIVLKVSGVTGGHDQLSTSLINSRVKISESQLAHFCRRNHINKLSLFGSVLREDFNPESDIDILVEFESGHVPGFDIINLEKELSRLLERKVDIRTPSDLSRYFRETVVREARVKYERT